MNGSSMIDASCRLQAASQVRPAGAPSTCEDQAPGTALKLTLEGDKYTHMTTKPNTSLHPISSTYGTSSSSSSSPCPSPASPPSSPAPAAPSCPSAPSIFTSAVPSSLTVLSLSDLIRSAGCKATTAKTVLSSLMTCAGPVGSTRVRRVGERMRDEPRGRAVVGAAFSEGQSDFQLEFWVVKEARCAT